MSRWVDVPIVGGSYADDTRDWSFQDTVNWLPMRAERPGGRSQAMLRDVPGLRLKSIIGTGPYRGMRDVEGKLFVVSGRTLFQVNTDFTATEIGTIPGTGPVSMTHNQVGLDGGNELVIGTTDSGYVYDTKAGTFTQITDPGFPGLQSADFIGGYVIGIEPQRRYWMHSELADAREWNTTDIYSAEAAPDRLTRVVVVGNEVVAIGERSTEVFVNEPRGNAAFQRATGVTQDKGSVSPHSVVSLDNTLFMLGSDGIVYRREGYNWVRISTHPIEQDISRCDLSRAFAFTYEDRGHAIYYLTFPDGKTWGYDVSQGEWARRESYGFDRWRVSGLVRWDGAWYAGDFANGKLYQVDWDYPGLEDQDEIVRKRTAGTLHDDYNRVAVNAVQLRVSSGLPEAAAVARNTIPATPNLAITGDFPDEGWQGDSEDFTYTITGGVAPYTVDVSSGALPGGIVQDGSTVRVHGKRTTVGPFNWTMRATDADGRTATVNDTSTTRNAEIFFWRQETVGIAVQQAYCSHVSGDVIAVGHGNGFISHSTDRGVSWSNAALASAMLVRGIVKYMGDWYCFGHNGSTNYAYKAAGDSFAWNAITMPFSVVNTAYQVASVIGDYLYVGQRSGVAGALNYTLQRFDGTSWESYDTLIAAPVNSHINTGIEVNGYYLFGTSDGKVLRTQDFSSWGVALDTGTGGRVTLAELDGRVLASSSSSLVHVSDDSGATFGPGYSKGPLASANGYHFILANGSKTVWTSTTGGEMDWTQRFNPSITADTTTIHTGKDLSVVSTLSSGVYVGDVA